MDSDRPDPSSVTYELTVSGPIPENMLKTFPGVVAEQRDGGTVLRAALPSREALQSMLVVIDLFELELIDVKRIPPDPAPETVTDAVALLRKLGYTDELVVGPEGLRAQGKDGVQDVHAALVDHIFRFEGPSDPADEAIVLGVRCPTLGVRGIVVSGYGAEIDPDHEAVLRALVER